MKRRLQVILSHGGISSRRKSVEIIEEGRVRVNGVVVREKGYPVDLYEDIVEIDGKPIAKEKNVYFILNKPKGVITTVSDEKGRKTVLNLLPKQKSRIFPVGRLDKDTEGVLLLTNDGELSYRLTHPRFGVEKVYVVEVKPVLRAADITRLEKGIFLDGKKTAPCKIRVLKKGRHQVILRVELHEGRKRQIRRMIGKMSGNVIRLCRISYAGIGMREMTSGAYRLLRPDEIEGLKKRCLMKESVS